MAQETAEKQAFLASIKEPEYVIVSSAMTAAGLERLRDLRDETDLAFIVDSVYMAMEYERRSNR
jgi:hypothetical protein